MVRTSEEQRVTKANSRGGAGEVQMRFLVNGAEELYGKGKLFNHMVMEPGVSVGLHAHDGDNEIYYILTGTGEYNDNGTIVTVKAGDVCICNDGETHALINTGSEVMEFIALVVNS